MRPTCKFLPSLVISMSRSISLILCLHRLISLRSLGCTRRGDLVDRGCQVRQVKMADFDLRVRGCLAQLRHSPSNRTRQNSIRNQPSAARGRCQSTTQSITLTFLVQTFPIAELLSQPAVSPLHSHQIRPLRCAPDSVMMTVPHSTRQRSDSGDRDQLLWLLLMPGQIPSIEGGRLASAMGSSAISLRRRRLR